MSKWEDSYDEIFHDTPAEKDTLIRAMEAAGYTLDTIESTDGHLRFFGEGGQTMTMAGWQESLRFSRRLSRGIILHSMHSAEIQA